MYKFSVTEVTILYWPAMVSYLKIKTARIFDEYAQIRKVNNNLFGSNPKYFC